MHTLVLTEQGEIYAFGDNSRSQLGTGHCSGFSPLPTFLEDLAETKIIKVRAGQFSAAMSIREEVFIWGEGYFGKHQSPKFIKKQIADVLDIQVSRGGTASIVTRQG